MIPKPQHKRIKKRLGDSQDYKRTMDQIKKNFFSAANANFKLILKMIQEKIKRFVFFRKQKKSAPGKIKCKNFAIFGIIGQRTHMFTTVDTPNEISELAY